MLTDEELDRLKELDQAASKNWRWEEYASYFDGDVDVYLKNDEEEGVFTETPSANNEADEEILVEARNALPKLLAEIDRLKAENQRLSSVSSTVIAAIWEQGRISAQVEQEANPYKEEAPSLSWSNLTEAIQSGADIDWEKMDGLPAKCVHPEQGSLKHHMKRDHTYDPRLAYAWYESGAGVWGAAFAHAFEGEHNWSLHVKGTIPLKG